MQHVPEPMAGDLNTLNDVFVCRFVDAFEYVYNIITYDVNVCVFGVCCFKTRRPISLFSFNGSLSVASWTPMFLGRFGVLAVTRATYQSHP